MSIRAMCFRAFGAAIHSVCSGVLVHKCLTLQDSTVFVNGTPYPATGRIVVFGIGKAALGMVQSVVDVLQNRLSVAVCCVPPPTSTSGQENDNESQSIEQNPNVHVFHGSCANLPNEEVVQGSQLMAEIAQSLDSSDLLIVCLTGGGSALLTLPMEFQSKQICLNAILETTILLSRCGANICELNTVRSCFDKLKSGGLASLAHPAQVVTLVISDVIGDPLHFIASGPTVVTDQPPWSKRLELCIEILEKYKLVEKIPPVIRAFLDSERVNPTRSEPVNDRVEHWILGNNRVALEAAAESLRKYTPADNGNDSKIASQFCLETVILTTRLSGCSTEKGKLFGELLWSIGSHLSWIRDHSSEDTSPYEEAISHLHTRLIEQQRDASVILEACQKLMLSATLRRDARCLTLVILLGGETTTVTTSAPTREEEEKPVGGRCSHMALAAAVRWYEMTHEDSITQLLESNHELSLLAGATDGLDGPAFGGAGVWITSGSEYTIPNDIAFNDAVNALNRTDSYGFFRRHAPSCIIPAKLTGTNVMDLFLGTASIHL